MTKTRLDQMRFEIAKDQMGISLLVNWPGKDCFEYWLGLLHGTKAGRDWMKALPGA